MLVLPIHGGTPRRTASARGCVLGMGVRRSCTYGTTTHTTAAAALVDRRRRRRYHVGGRFPFMATTAATATAIVASSVMGRRTRWSPRRTLIHLGILVGNELRWLLLRHVQLIRRRRQQTFVLGHCEKPFLLRLTRMMLVFYGLMFRRISPIVLSVAIANGHTCCRSGRHRCAFTLSTGGHRS